MNEKIKLLAEQASSRYDQSDGDWSLDTIKDKFAELIIRECADFADEHNDYSEGVTLGVGQALKKHFGVEE